MPARHALFALAFACVGSWACGTPVDLGGSADASPSPDVDAAPPVTCPGFAAPTTSAKCKACAPGSKGCPAMLQPNGCYGGYYCELSHRDCQSMNDACDGGHAEASK
jgi:hypothetical protein